MTISTEDSSSMVVPPPSTPLSTDTTKPSISVVTIQSSLFMVANLNKEINNWQEWSDNVLNHLAMSGGIDGHLLNCLPCPDKSLEPRAYMNWQTNDRAICAFMNLKAVKAEKDFMSGHSSSSKAVWTALKMCHEQEGPIIQVNLIQEALNIRYSRSEWLAITTSRLVELNTRIWKMGSPSPNLFLCILMLNSLSGELATVRTSIAPSINCSTKTNPVSSSNIRRDLDTQQQLFDTDDAKANDIALSVTTTTCPCLQNTASTPNLCINPKCPTPNGHTMPYCVVEGGGMEGKTIDESRAAKKCDREAKRGGDQSKKSTLSIVKDNAGKAYLFDPTAGSITPISISDASPQSEKMEFTTLTSDAEEASECTELEMQQRRRH
ncbi:hypothetical protein IW261DRAFT_1573431 [Armillaria novae-zelandiae]|uniref:Uncharacterized protein n=1 Tax=Armillaria novae-zelandiae TaxID=153914 RepID=A0AA39NNB0_9AGAR|nr:hypothetical protein IW261DRAFT_1573431 [Armillaria novae-zelandiae]